MKPGTLNTIAASALLALVGLNGLPLLAQTQPSQKSEAAPSEDIIIFKSGKTLQGKIVSQTPTSVRFKGLIAGIEAEIDYPMADVLTIKKGTAPSTEKAPAGGTTSPVPTLPRAGGEPVTGDTQGKTKVYWMELTGDFGQDISETPVRNALRDAKRSDAEMIIVVLDADWKEKDGVVNADKANDQDMNFDGLWRAEKIIPVFVDEMRQEWGTPPRVVFWVKQAMSGAAFLPLWCPEMYFSSNARLGGVGNLSFIFGSTGDDVVREKQRSLRLGHAEGWANLGGYDVRIIRAMARAEYVMSYRFVDGKVELFEGYPQAPGEELLTDDGKEGNMDSLGDRVRGTGNDTLTLDARTAKIVGLSKGTVDTRDELLHELGLERTSVVIPGRSKQIMKEWSEGLDASKKRIRILFDDYGDIQVQGDYQERTRARGQQIRKLEEIKQLLVRWGEGLDVWIRENGVPSIPDIATQQEQIRLQQLADRR
jgi:hypothetical protein